jgi:hypothetical protein
VIPEVVPTGLVVGEETVDGDVTVGIVSITGAAPTVGNTPIVGTAAAELTPRLPISVDPIGIPVRAVPPGVVDDVGVDDEVRLLEPEPHIPDIPAVFSIPDIVVVPDVAALAGAAIPTAIPPPSKLAVDPNIVDGAVPKVEHVVPLLVLGVTDVPVTPGIGLTPGETTSVAPNGIPVGATAEFVVMPSGEVAPTVGVGATIPVTCAMAALQTKRAGRTAATNANFMGVLRLPSALPRRPPISVRFVTIPLGARLSNIGQSLSGSA